MKLDDKALSERLANALKEDKNLFSLSNQYAVSKAIYERELKLRESMVDQFLNIPLHMGTRIETCENEVTNRQLKKMIDERIDYDQTQRDLHEIVIEAKRQYEANKHAQSFSTESHADLNIHTVKTDAQFIQVEKELKDAHHFTKFDKQSALSVANESKERQSATQALLTLARPTHHVYRKGNEIYAVSDSFHSQMESSKHQAVKNK